MLDTLSTATFTKQAILRTLWLHDNGFKTLDPAVLLPLRSLHSLYASKEAAHNLPSNVTKRSAAVLFGAVACAGVCSKATLGCPSVSTTAMAAWRGVLEPSTALLGVALRQRRSSWETLLAPPSLTPLISSCRA